MKGSQALAVLGGLVPPSLFQHSREQKKEEPSSLVLSCVSGVRSEVAEEHLLFNALMRLLSRCYVSSPLQQRKARQVLARPVWPQGINLCPACPEPPRLPPPHAGCAQTLTAPGGVGQSHCKVTSTVPSSRAPSSPLPCSRRMLILPVPDQRGPRPPVPGPSGCALSSVPQACSPHQPWHQTCVAAVEHERSLLQFMFFLSSSQRT